MGFVEEIKGRKAINRSAMVKMQKIWGNRTIIKATNSRLLGTLISPVSLFAAETGP